MFCAAWVALLLWILAPAASAQTVSIADTNLEAAVRQQLGKPSGVLMQADMLLLTNLTASSRGVRNLSGLETATNLVFLEIGWQGGQVTNVSVLSNLRRLTHIGFQSSGVKDASFARQLTNLTYLDLYSNQVRDASPLAGLTNLTYLHLGWNQTTNLQLLSGLTRLTLIGLAGNSLTSAPFLQPMGALETLALDYNQLSTFPSLSFWRRLKSLNMDSNPFGAVPPASAVGPTNIQQLLVRNCQIPDLAFVTNLPTLTSFYFDGNLATNSAPLAALTNLTELYITKNRLTNITSLTGLLRLRTVDLRENYLDISAGSATLTQIWALTNRGVSVLYTPQNSQTPCGPLEPALDSTGLTWTTGGASPWCGQTIITHDGVDAAQSGAITDNQQSWLETTVTGPGTLSFWWKVSSEQDWDYLSFLMDGQTNASITGNTSWLQWSNSIPAGSHTLRWVYWKDESGSSGTDAGWLDQVSFVSTGTAPQITGSPTNRAVMAGAQATFAVTASGTAPLSYQWFFNTNTAILNATSASLSLTNVQPANAGAYSVRVTNLYGAATSSVAMLTVGIMPSITQQPQPATTVVAGSTISLSVTASNATGYLWLFNGSPLANGGRIAGATSAALTITNAQTTDTGPYRVVVTNASMAYMVVTSSVATVTVGLPPAITQQPQPTNVVVGSTVSLSVTVSNATGYQWLLSGNPLANGGRISGATSTALTITNAQTADSGPYRVIISNAYTAVTSLVATVTVTNQPPAIVTPPMSVAVLQGTNATFTVAATGTAPLSYQWFFNTNTALPNATSASLTLTNVQLTNAGAYSVRVTNVAGAATSSVATLTVGLPPAITLQPQSTNLVVGSTVRLSVTASNATGYQWLFNGIALANGGRVSGGMSAALTITNAQTTDTGPYRVLVFNAYTTVTSLVAIVTVTNQPPSIVVQPQSQTATPGGNVLFSVSASGTAPLTYRWLFNGSPAAGGTSSNLLLTAVQSNAIGSYQVIITNAGGAATSSIVLLDLRAPGLLAAESFAYPTGSIAGLDGGTGFRTPYTGNGGINTGSLAYMDTNGAILSVSSNHLTTFGTNTPIFRYLQTNGVPPALLDANGKFGANGSVIYVAVLCALASGDNTGYGGLSLWDDNSERFFLGDPGFANYLKWGLDLFTGTPRIFESTYPVDSQMRLLVARIDFQSVGDTVRLYVDPPLTAEPATAAIGPITMPDFRFNRIRFNSGPGNGGSPAGGTHDFDEMRIGTSFASVLPIGRQQLRITQQPASTNVPVGFTATFTASAVGMAPISYQWFFNGTTPLPAGTNASLQLTNVQLAAAGNYHLVVTDAFGTTNSAVATLSVFETPDLQVTKLQIPTATYTEREFEVKWSVKNSGRAAALSNWVDRVYLSPDTQAAHGVLIGEFAYSGGLSVNQIITRIQTVSIASGQATNGNYRIIVVTDDGNTVNEGLNEANNSLASAGMIAVTRLPMPDLIVESIEAPTNALPGQTITVRYTVRNIGDGATDVPQWADWIYLSSDTWPEMEDVVSFGVPNVTYLGPGESYVGTAQIPITNTLFGTYYVLAYTDNDGMNHQGGRHAVVESNERNNWTNSAPIQIQYQGGVQPDLTVMDVQSATDGFTDEDITVDWSVGSLGASRAPLYLAPAPGPDWCIGDPKVVAWPVLTNGTLAKLPEYDKYTTLSAAGWVDSVYLSADTNLTASSKLLGHFLYLKIGVLAYCGPVTLSAPAPAQSPPSVASLGTVSALLASLSEPPAPENSRAAKDPLIYSLSVTVKVPRVASGNYHVAVMTDSSGALREANEENNVTFATSPLRVTLQPYPDLVITSVTAPTNGTAGAPLLVSWQGRNQGTGPVTGLWYDSVYACTNAVMDKSAILLTNVSQGVLHVNLSAGASYTTAVPCWLPTCVPVPLYFFVVADSYNWASEFSVATDAEANNTNRTVGTTLAAPAPLPDLQVTSLSAPTNGAAGRPFRVSWSVTNAGPVATALSLWTDRLYLARGAQLDANAVPIGELGYYGFLTSGSSYTNTTEVTLPADVAGAYYLIVSTDVSNTVAECSGDANNTTNSPVAFQVKPFDLPDLQVSQVAAPTSALSGEFITVSYALTNAGPGYVGARPWYDGIYVSSDSADLVNATLVGIHTNNGPFLERTGTQIVQTVQLPYRLSGPQYLVVWSDATSLVAEGANEGNNVAVAAVPMQVTQVPLCDLVVTNISVPPNALSGQELTLSWRVVNAGLAATVPTNWSDYVYISRDQVLDPTDAQVGWARHDGGLAVDGGYTQTLTVTLPRGLSGPCYLFVSTDKRGEITELDEFNNTLISPTAVQIILPSPADLRVMSVASLPASAPGQMATFNWAVTNAGVNAATGDWYDAVYLSPTNVWDLNATLVGYVQHLGPLAAGAAYPASLTERIPGITPGNYYVLVRTDVRNAVRETNEQNNTGTSAGTTSLDVIELTLGTPYTNQFTAAGTEHYYKVHTPSNETMRVTLDAAETTGYNELFTRFGEMPSRSRYDFAYSYPSSPDQQITVPETQDCYYYHLARAESAPSVPDYQIKAEVVPFGITSVAPARIGDNGQVTLTVGGARFEHGTTAQLVAAGVTLDARVIQLDSVSIKCRFLLTNATLGSYQLVVRNPAGEVARWSSGVVVEPATGFMVDVQAGGDLRPRVGRTFTASALLSNCGNTDIPYVFVSADCGGQLDMAFRRPQGTLPLTLPPPDFAWGNGLVFESGGTRFTHDQFIVRNLEAGQRLFFDLLARSFPLGRFGVKIYPQCIAGDDLLFILQTVLEERRQAALLDPSVLPSADLASIVTSKTAWWLYFRSEFESLGLLDSGIECSGLSDAGPQAIRSARFDNRTPKDACPECTTKYQACINNCSLLGCAWCWFLDAICRLECEPIDGDGGSCTGFGSSGGNAIVASRPTAGVAFAVSIRRGMSNAKSLTPGGGGGGGGVGICVSPTRPADPNEIVGPGGFGPQQFIAVQNDQPYTVFFENVPTASAYAQRISIANNLDASFDPSSMRLKEIAFGNYTITVPEGRSFYQKRVQLGAEFNYLLADISAGLDIEARQIRWTLTAIDPATGEPPESALLGLLPPNTTNHIGEGHVSYTIKALPGTPTGTIVSNQAVIVFDVNEPIATPSVWNTIDGDLPTSAVASLPVAISNATCVVSWSGQDPTNGSGLASYDIYVSDNGATYIPWLVGTTDTNALFTGVNEHTYYFYSVARDNSGNVEDVPLVPDTATTLYFNSPPTLAPIDNYTVVVNATLMFTNSATDPDLPKQTLTYSLDTNAPASATINPTNGIFHWQPDRNYGSTTNVITVRVTDNGLPPMSSARSFAVSVAEYVEPSLGSLVLHTNQSGCLPISLLSSVGLTNVTLRVEFATNRVSNLSVHALSTNVCTPTVVPVSGGALVTLGACAGKVFQGEQQLAELCFNVPPQVSAFVSLVITDTTARKANGEKVVNLVNNPGRLTVIGNEPLLEAGFGSNREPFLTLYGQPGNEYTLEYKTNLTATTPWTDFRRISVTNSVTTLGALGYDGQQGGRFFRARRE